MGRKNMKKIYYNKLIRDKIPRKIKKNGGDFKVKKLKNKNFGLELLKKVGEEAGGLLNSNTKEELISKLADVLDVIEEIKKFKKIKDKQIKNAQKLNFKIKGGFQKRLFLFWSSDTSYRSNERKYKKYYGV